RTFGDLTLAAEVEDLVLLGAARVGHGNALANHITGNDLGDTLTGDAGGDTLTGGAGVDLLDGGSGADQMTGGAGDDTYVVDIAGDVVVELTGEGTDTVRASVNHVLGANVENLVLEGLARSGTGNALANHITANDFGDALNGAAGNDSLTGGAGADALNGGLGADTMEGGAGNDSYTADDAGDVIIELPGGGTDTVKASISFTLAADLEKLALTGVADLTGTGNALANSLTGNAGANLLVGLEGNDALNGGLGADTMDGGAGNDTYTVDNAGDVIIELPGGGTDMVKASISFTLAADVENLTLTGIADLAGTGNAGANSLTGNAGANLLLGLEGNDLLNGGLGADTMEGGAGNDSYTVDNAGDVVIEAPGGGNDLVRASISYTLGADVEKLALSGLADLDGTGNALVNSLTGNAGANLLSGMDGNDVLSGGAGNDTLLGGNGADVLTGGLGADVFRFGSAAEGSDRITDFITGTDTLEFSMTGFGGGLSIGMDFAAEEAFVLGAVATRAHGQFLYMAATGALSWDVDGTGSAAAQAIASFSTHPALVAGDLHVFG
ncbi:MAG: calcium-binding protein, partial [Roseococcus sp.]